MYWTQEHAELLAACQRSGGGWQQIANLAVELGAELGGAMSHNLLSQVLGHIAAGASDHKTAAQIGQHLVAQGEQVAQLKETIKAMVDVLENGREVSLQEQINEALRLAKSLQ